MQLRLRIMLCLFGVGLFSLPSVQADGGGYGAPATTNTHLPSGGHSGGGNSRAGGGSYHHHHHYANALGAVQQFNSALQSAFLNPFDPGSHAAVSTAVNALNSSIAAIRSDINSGELSGSDLPSVEQGLAGAVNAGSLKNKTQEISNPSQSNLDAGISITVPDLSGKSAQNSMSQSASQVTVISGEFINLNPGQDSLPATKVALQGGSVGSGKIALPTSTLSPSEGASPNSTANSNVPFGFVMALRPPEQVAALKLDEEKSGEDLSSAKKVQPLIDLAARDSLDDAAPNPRQAEPAVEDPKEGPASEAIAVIGKPKRPTKPVYRQLDALFTQSKKNIRSHRGAGLNRTATLAPQILLDAEREEGVGMTAMEKVFAWSRVGLLGFIFCTPLFVLFYLLGISSRRKKLGSVDPKTVHTV